MIVISFNCITNNSNNTNKYNTNIMLFTNKLIYIIWYSTAVYLFIWLYHSECIIECLVQTLIKEIPMEYYRKSEREKYIT